MPICLTKARLATGSKVSSNGRGSGYSILNTAGLGKVRIVFIMSRFMLSYVLTRLFCHVST